MGIEGLPPFDAAQEQDAPPKKRNNQATEATCRATSDSWWPPASPFIIVFVEQVFDIVDFEKQIKYTYWISFC